ncbi:MAG: sortase [Oscillospiraceae bacterium]|nr:sortase [Oscillospiraceae bacterium]
MSNEKNEYTVENILEEYDRGGADKDSSDDNIQIETDTEEEIFEDTADDDIEIVNEIIEEVSVDEGNEALPDMAQEMLFWEDAAEEEVTEEDAAEPSDKDGNTDLTEDNGDTDNAEAEENGDTSGNSEKENEDMSEEKNTEACTSEDTESSGFWSRILPVKGDSIAEIIRKIIFIAAVIVFVGAGIMLISTLVQSKKALSDKDEVKEIIATTVATTMDEDGNIVTIAPTEEEVAEHNFNVAEHFKSINEDYVGYLELPGCGIYEPVMQSSEEDRSYYLTHTYYGGVNKAGAIYADSRCTISEEYTSPNLVIYGHNQEDGTMFGNLKLYKNDLDFYKENPVIKFSPEFETGEYLIYGYFVTHVYPNQDSNGVVFHYQDYIETMNDEDTFNWYQEMVRERNRIISPVDVEYGDQLLCLSTCSNEFSNSRFVIFARKLRDGEKVSDYDFSKARFNPNAKGVDWSAIMSDQTTTTVSEEVSETSDETTVPEDTEDTGDSEDNEETSEEKNTDGDNKKPKKTTALKNYMTSRKKTGDETTVSVNTKVTDETTVPESSETTDETSVPDSSDTTVETSVPESSESSSETTDITYDYGYSHTLPEDVTY